MKLNGKQIQMAIMQLVEDFKFDAMHIVDIVKMWLKSAFKKDYPDHKKANVMIDIDEEGNINVYEVLEVVTEITDEYTQILLKDAKKEAPDVQAGEELYIDITPEELWFSRIAVQAAAQTIKQHLKWIEKERFYEKFQDKQWELLKWKVIRVSPTTVVLDIDWVPVVLPPQWQIPHRVYEMWEDVFVFLKQIAKWQWWVVLDITQSSEEYIWAILKKIVPEIEDNIIHIDKIVRIAWKKTKVLVSTTDTNVDPIWVMVWQGWDRINIILSLLEWEKIDYVENSDNLEELLRDCLKPAEVTHVVITNTTATVTVPERHKALAIGKWASNIKLAWQITWLRIEIV